MPERTLRRLRAPAPPDEQTIRRVLVVDDSRVQRRVLASYLRHLGHEVVEAASGRQALEGNTLETIDLILTDWMMPDVDGLELCRAVRERQRDRYIYLILLTMRSEKVDMAEALVAGVDNFLTKPAGLLELKGRIIAASRIIAMERELVRRNHLANTALTELQGLYDAVDRDLVEARRLQQSLVRERQRSFPGADVAVMVRPAGHVGGDLAGFYRIGEHGLGLYTIDVSGHGVASAILTARIASYLTGETPGHNMALRLDRNGNVTGRTPAAVAALMNRVMLGEVETGHYFTMLLVHVDLRSGCVELVQAGHPPALLQTPDGSVRRLGDGGMPIGLVSQPVFGTLAFTMAPGERLLICSDGFAECRDPHDIALEEHGLIAMLEKLHPLQGQDFLEALTWALSDFSEGRPFPDDLSAVLFEYRGGDGVPA